MSFTLVLTGLIPRVIAEEMSPPPPEHGPTSGGEDMAAYRSMSMQDLMDVDVVTVTSVSRRPENVATSPSAIQVISQADIDRSGATTLPEALRLATNLDVAQADSHTWAISARGFNNTLADKMLVMIDGRSVYTPLFAGVFWDAQDTLLHDIDHIEVISGPGATQWGANAVNGVINIISKNSRDTQGLYLEAGGGTTLREFEAVRYGGQIDPHLTFRVYEKTFHRDNVTDQIGTGTQEEWDSGQGGFRADYDGDEGNLFTVQGDTYRSHIEQSGTSAINAVGSNILGRWTHTIADNSDLRLQLYYDLAHRSIPDSIIENLHTYDLDIQHRFPLAPRNDLVWGFGYRVVHDDITNPATLAFLPPTITYQWFNIFAQDEIAVIPDHVTFDIGSKVEHNHYTGFEEEPSGRLAWRVDAHQTVWSAVSRAVRTPSRIDSQFFAPATPPYLLVGSPDFDSEKVIAYELGYRLIPERNLSCSLSTYYNDYADLRSVEELTPPAPSPVVFGNGLEGESYGAEFAADWNPIAWLRLRAGYTELRLHLRRKSGSTDTSNGSVDSHDSNHLGSLRTSIDFPDHWQLDANLRYASAISNQDVPAYAELDARLGWSPVPAWEFSLVGQNLLHDHHVEFGAPANRQAIERSGYVKVVWRP